MDDHVFVDRRTFEHLKSAEIVDTPKIRGLSDPPLSSWTSSYRSKLGSHAPCDCPTNQGRREHRSRVGLPRRSSPEAPS